MSEPTETNPPVQDEGGFFSRAAEHVFPHLEHAEVEAGHIATDVRAALQDHAGTVFDVAGDAIALLKLIDPADAALFAAAEAFLPKVLAMTEKAAALASAALKAALRATATHSARLWPGTQS